MHGLIRCMQHHLTFFAWLVLSPSCTSNIETCVIWPIFSRLWLLHRQHAARYESEFLEDMDALGCRRPDVMTRVSEYMTEIVEYIQTIMSNNMAYERNGSVHFDTQAFRYMHLGDLPTPDAMCSLDPSSHCMLTVQSHQAHGSSRQPENLHVVRCHSGCLADIWHAWLTFGQSQHGACLCS